MSIQTKTKTPNPFVGVCGARSADDLLKLENLASEIPDDRGYFLMAGVKNAAEIQDYNIARKRIRPFVHCDFSAQIPFDTVVSRNLEISAGWVRGLQLNILPWTDVDYSRLFAGIKSRYPRVVLMLQAHKRIMDENSPRQIVEKLRTLPMIDYIFFDPSQSRGIGYDVGEMIRYVDVVYNNFPALGVAVAGGLGPRTLEPLFGPIIKKYPKISCDAFGKLNDPATDSLSWPDVDSYFAAWKKCSLKTPA